MGTDGVGGAKPPRKAGRPSKKELAATKDMTKREVSAALREFRSRILLHPKSERFINHLFECALDDEHRNSGVAMKILADRMLPASGFSADTKGAPSVSINITGIGAEQSAAGVVIDGHSGSIDEGDDYDS